MSDEAPSIREAIEASLSAAEAPETPSAAPAESIQPAAAPAAAPADTEQAPAAVKQPPRERQGDLFKSQQPLGAPQQPAKDPQQPVKAPQQPTSTPESVQNKAPSSWKPEIREKWSALPPEVQSEVIRREKEVQATLHQAAQARQFAEAFQQVAQPYAHLIALEGNDPLKAFGDYLRTATVLRSGGPAEKANAVAQACRNFGVDLRMLDAALAGQALPQPQQQPGQQFQDPRVDQLFQFLSQREQEAQIRKRQDLDSEIESFANDPKNEFFEDLRADISIMLRTMAEAGRTMTLKEAYDRAAMLHPEIGKIVQQRQAAQQAATQQQSLQAKRNAASSLRNTAPAQTGNQGDRPLTVRQAVEQSLATLGG
jgi:hypothetical protein